MAIVGAFFLIGAFFVAGSGAAPPYVFAVCEESWKKKELEKKKQQFLSATANLTFLFQNSQNSR